MLLEIFVFLVLCTGTYSDVICPFGAVVGPDNNCYVINTDGINKTANWLEYKNWCSNVYDGDLVSIHDAFENSYFAQIAANYTNSNSQLPYIGAYCAPNTNYKWVWVDGTCLNYTNWSNPSK
jgi:hypothetical protein